MYGEHEINTPKRPGASPRLLAKCLSLLLISCVAIVLTSDGLAVDSSKEQIAYTQGVAIMKAKLYLLIYLNVCIEMV